MGMSAMNPTIQAREKFDTFKEFGTQNARARRFSRDCLRMMLATIVLAGGTAYAQASRGATIGMAQIARSARSAPTLLQILIGQTPATIPANISFLDPTGVISSFLPTGPVSTDSNPFFSTAITSNGRSCFTCHTPQSGWAISPPQIATVFLASRGRSPLFQPVDAANCPDTPGATNPLSPKFLAAHSQLFKRGNFRIALNAPNPLSPPGTLTFNGSSPEWVMIVKSDPTGCENDPTYGLPAGLASVYRRPLPSANVAFLNPGARGPTNFNIMWDAREPSLENQFINATEFHGQTTISPVDTDAQAGADFQLGVFTAQSANFPAGDLTGGDGSGAAGGPELLFDSRLNVPSSNGIPIPGECFSLEPLDGQNAFCPGIFGRPDAFTIYSSFANASTTTTPQMQQRASIAWGEAIFNSVKFTINDVAGLDDVLNPVGPTNPPGGPNSTVVGTCATCHNNLNVGNDNFLDPKRTGIMDNSNNTNDALPPSSDFPLFAFYCPSGSMNFFSNPVQSSYCQLLPGQPTTCDEFDTTDPGLGLITGRCNDLGKMKVPVLRGLASRAPYFHGGNVPSLAALVDFYNKRFNIGLSAQQKADLVNFLNAL